MMAAARPAASWAPGRQTRGHPPPQTSFWLIRLSRTWSWATAWAEAPHLPLCANTEANRGEERRRFREQTIVGSCSLRPALRRTTTCSTDLNDRSSHGPKSLQERPISGLLRKLAFSATAAVPDRLYWLRLPGPGFVRWCPALPRCSGHGVLAPENPSDGTAVRERRLPGRTSHPGPTPLNRLFSGSLRTG